MRPITVSYWSEPEAAVLWKRAKAEMVEREEWKKDDDVPRSDAFHQGIESLISWLGRAAKSI